MKVKVTITFTITEDPKDYDLVNGKKVTPKQIKKMVKKDYEDIDYLDSQLPLLSWLNYKVTVK